jgi:ubiquinone/menaquinone biosynthesis C-methylase UbiE
VNPKEFYDSMYGDEFTDRAPATRTRILDRVMQRYTINRYELTDENLPGQGRALDLGCGDGEVLFAMSNKYDEVWGVDIVQKRIDRIKTKTGGEGKIHLKVADLNERLDFADDYFDCVTIVNVLEHLFDPFAIVHECHRLLRPGGTVIVHVPNVASALNRIRLLVGRLPTTSRASGWDGGHLHYFTQSSLKQLLQKERFNVVKITAGGPFGRFLRAWGSLLCGDILIVGEKT